MSFVQDYHSTEFKNRLMELSLPCIRSVLQRGSADSERVLFYRMRKAEQMPP